MTLKALDNLNREYEIKRCGEDFIINKEEIHDDTEFIEISAAEFNAVSGDNGYYVIADCDNKGSYLCRFNERQDCNVLYKQNLMPIFGIKNRFGCTLGIVKGLRQNFYVAAGVKDNNYYFKLRFEITTFGADEDIRFSLISLKEDADYTEMANIYRDYQIKNGNCVPLKERVKTNEYLRYAAESPEIRIRMGWKPAPPPVLEQTLENEPEMQVACTFERVKDIIDELKRQGVDKAQICLVGWNVSGHDGRYPQIFPVEEKLGGEEKLKELIAYAKEMGYQIVCHTNSTDCYSIADSFSNDIVIKNADGELAINDMPWSGGNMYHLCPVKALEYAKKDLPQVVELGFKGLHYIDVMSVIPLRECYDKNHLSNKKKTLECYEEIMKICHDNFGGFASEGAYDFASKYLDFALYVSFADLESDFADEEIPLYELVYHGIILYNPSTTTVNASIKGKEAMEKLKNYGGRPSFYFYSKHLSGSSQDDWLGREDLICDTDEQLRYSVAKIKEVLDDYDYKTQYEFITEYKV